MILFGAGYFKRKQYVKGILVTALQVFIFIFYPTALWPYLSKFNTLGTVKRAAVFNPETMKNEVNDFDHSFMILLFGLVAIVVFVTMIAFWMKNLHAVRQLQLQEESGKKINRFSEDVRDLLNKKFHITLLTLPSLGVILFTIIPLLVMLCVAFTNYDQTPHGTHQLIHLGWNQTTS